MSMSTVQFFRNNYSYPDYTENLTPQTPVIDCTPKGLSTRGGQLHIAISWGEIVRCNYIRVRRDGHSFWAWVDNISERTANSVVVDYSTDAWRTWKGNTRLGRQYVARHPHETLLYDELLSSDTQSMTQDVHRQTFSSTDKRILVVQVRRLSSVDLHSNTPVQPTPYQFYFTDYETNNWVGSSLPIQRLLNALLTGAETENIVTIYSLPYMDISDLSEGSLPIRFSGGDTQTVSGFRYIGEMTGDPVSHYLTRSVAIGLPYNRYEFFQVKHDLKILIPGAGVMQISDEALEKGNLRIRQDVDLYSGASNFMLTCGQNNDLTGQSIRGSSVSSIPILSDPFDTYLSQNQNALTTSMVGDVASVVMGGMTLASGALGNPLALAGGGQVMSGVRGMYGRSQSLADARNALPSNPPSFLGTAMANHFNNVFYLLATYDEPVNRTEVNLAFGYPVGRVQVLEFPESGFIQTQNCAITTDGTAPKWAVDEINALFDAGIRVH